MKKTHLFLVLIFLFIASCATAPESKKDTGAAKISTQELPKTVAILPFENKTQQVGISNVVRKAFYNHFSSKSYSDIELNVIDEKIVQLEKSTGKSILDIPPKEICEAIGCDGLIYGKITDYTKVYAGVYSQLGIEAEVWMVNTKTGKEVFRIKDSVKYHEGGIPLSPLSAIMTAISTAMNIRDIQQLRMVDELCYKLNEKIPSPSTTIEERPVIKEVITNAKESPFGKGKIVRVGVEADKGLITVFDIGNFKKGILLKETQPGIYIGEYTVLPSDNVKEAPIIVYLRKPNGYETQWIDISGFVTIDTTPPPQVKGLKARGFNDRIEISWEPIVGISDLSGYKVLRSEQPLTGFKEIAKVEDNSFEDTSVEYGKIYYYRVIAYDKAGNESDIQDAIKASIVSNKPQVLTNAIEKDAVFAGTYIVKDNFRVPKGLTLTILPGTRFMFDENAEFIVDGKIIIDAKETPVEFISQGDKKWKGIIANNAYVDIKGFRIKNAQTGISLSSSEGVVESGVITDCDRGILVSGVVAASFKNITASANKIAIEFIKTDARLTLSNIFQNETGIKLDAFSGEIKDNNIYDNSVNIASKALTKVGANYFGSINKQDLKLNQVEVELVYDDKIPQGKIVQPSEDIYAKLTEEQRQQKANELVIEAGAYFRERNYGKAVTFFEEALKAKPSAEIYYYLALCYQEMKENDKALAYLKDGVKKFPHDSNLYKSLGLLYYQSGKDNDAKQAFEEVLKLNPEDRQVKFLMERLTK